MFPVEVEYCGTEPPEQHFGFVRCGDDGSLIYEDCPANMLPGMTHELHAVIYTDGYVVVTLNEHCYAMWSARDGECFGGNLWKSGEWRITKEGLERLSKIARPKRNE
jgi:hypothetical protein